MSEMRICDIATMSHSAVQETHAQLADTGVEPTRQVPSKLLDSVLGLAWKLEAEDDYLGADILRSCVGITAIRTAGPGY